MALEKPKRCVMVEIKALHGWEGRQRACHTQWVGSTLEETRERPFQVIRISNLVGGGAKRRSVENRVVISSRSDEG